MFKPGTLIEKIALKGVDTECPIGTLATVRSCYSSRDPEISGDMMAYIDYHGNEVAVYSRYWRKLDGNDTNGITTVADLVRSLNTRQPA